MLSFIESFHQIECVRKQIAKIPESQSPGFFLKRYRRTYILKKKSKTSKFFWVSLKSFECLRFEIGLRRCSSGMNFLYYDAKFAPNT